MSWTDITGETGYTLERSIDNSTWSTQATLGANVTSYTDNSVTALNHYYYRLKGTSGSVTSADYTTILTATPPTTPSAAP